MPNDTEIIGFLDSNLSLLSESFPLFKKIIIFFYYVLGMLITAYSKNTILKKLSDTFKLCNITY